MNRFLMFAALVMPLGLCAETTPKEAELLEKQRAHMFQPKYLARGLGLEVPPLTAAALTGGALARAIKHERCEHQRDCEMDVYYGDPGVDPVANDCRVSMPDAWVLWVANESITWVLRQHPQFTGAPRRFKVSATGDRLGLDFVDNNANPNDQTIWDPKSSEVFTIESQTDRRHKRAIDGLRKKLPKVFYYGVQLEYEESPGNWKDCDPYDPIVVNRGG